MTNKQLYEAIMEVHKKMDEIVDNRVVPLEKWQSKITGQLAVLGTGFIILTNLFIEWVKEKFKI